MARILVVNPNSSAEVTAGIAAALAPLGDHFEVAGDPAGPETIRTDADVETAGRAFAARVARRPDAAGFVTCCFSDPGLDLARAATPQPVTGAQEAAVLAACDAAARFGIIALSERAIPRHRARIDAMGLSDRLLEEVALSDVSAADSGRDPAARAQMRALAASLRDRGAGAIVLGCAGMAEVAARLERDIGVPVIDPVLAAGRLALRRAAKERP